MLNANSAPSALPITFVVLTYNEEANLDVCLNSVCDWVGEILVVDSGSSDATLSIAAKYGAQIFNHSFETHARQWTWALANLPFHFDWVLALDADQSVTLQLRRDLAGLFLASSTVLNNVQGVFVRRQQIFRGKWIRHGGYYPKYLLKLFRRTQVLMDENDLMDHHFYVSGKALSLHSDIVENNHKEADIAFWIEKHNRYAVLHAHEELLRRQARPPWPIKSNLFGNPDQQIIWIKSRWYSLPLYLRPVIYFSYRYIVQLGFLDGKQGFIFHFLQGFWYRLLVDINLDDLLGDQAPT